MIRRNTLTAMVLLMICLQQVTILVLATSTNRAPVQTSPPVSPRETPLVLDLPRNSPEQSPPLPPVRIHDAITIEVNEPAHVIVDSPNVWANAVDAESGSTDLEKTTYKVAATVVDVLPNGTLILEAQRLIRTDRDVVELRLSGRIPRDKIAENRSARTEDIAELRIERRLHKADDRSLSDWKERFLEAVLPFMTATKSHAGA